LAQPKTYNIYLRFFDGTDWYYHTIDANGNYFANITPTELPHAPEGWKEITASWERAFTYYGMFTAYTSPLKFVLEGATILRHLMFTDGIEAQCELWVEKLNTQTGAYETFFKADLDLSTAVSEYDHVSCAIMENGMIAKIKAKEDTLFEYDIDGNPDVHYIKHDGIELQAKLSWTGTPFQNFDFFPDLNYYDTEGTNISIKHFTQDFGSSGSNSTFLQNTSGSSISIDFTTLFNITVTTGVGTSNANAQLMYGLYPIGGTFSAYYYILNSSFVHGASTVHNYAGADAQTIVVPNGYGLTLLFRLLVISGGGAVVPSGDYSTVMHGMKVDAYFINRYEETYVPCLKAMDVFKYLAKSISEDKNGVQDATMTITSTLLETTHDNEIFIFSGDAGRGLAGSKLKTCLTDFFKTMHVITGATLFYNKLTNEISLEHLDRVFEPTNNPSVSTVTSINNVKVYPFIQEAFVNFKVGCGVYNYDQKSGSDNEITNGKDDPFHTSNWLSPLIRIKKDVDYVSPYRYDVHGIEHVRVNLSDKKLADASSDNDVFVIHAENDNSNTYTIPETGVTINYHNIFRTPILTGTWEILNIFSPDSMYNIKFTPTRSIKQANGKWFRSLFKLNDSDYLRFQVSSKNNANSVKMQTKTGGVVDFDEGANIQISSLCNDGDEYFYPLVMEFETIEPVNIYNIIEGYPFYTIPVEYNDVVYNVYILTASSKPADRATSSFKCLVAIDNDITDLIR
jgi:hypothetical protein